MHLPLLNHVVYIEMQHINGIKFHSTSCKYLIVVTITILGVGYGAYHQRQYCGAFHQRQYCGAYHQRQYCGAFHQRQYCGAFHQRQYCGTYHQRQYCGAFHQRQYCGAYHQRQYCGAYHQRQYCGTYHQRQYCANQLEGTLFLLSVTCVFFRDNYVHCAYMHVCICTVT